VVAEMETRGNKLRSGLEQVANEAGMSEHATFPGPALVSRVYDQRPPWPAVSSVPHSFHSGATAPRSPRTIFRNLRRSYRRRYPPVSWHIMRYYAHFGHDEFILCLGYGAHSVKDYFLDYHETHSNDFVLDVISRRGPAI
jgi:hypothetical protein